MQTAGGKLPVPVSSYTTSTPVALKTRRAVMPVHDAAGYSSGHMLTVNVCPADAVTPQFAELSVSVFVLATLKAPHSVTPVGARVGTALGAALGAVGLAVGMAEGSAGRTVGPGVGSADGTGLGSDVVGDIVGIDDGNALGATVETTVGIAEGSSVGSADVGTCVGVAVGLKITAVTSEPAMTDWPVHAVLAMQPCRMM